MGLSIFRNLADFTVLTRNNIDHTIAYIGVLRAHVLCVNMRAYVNMRAVLEGDTVVPPDGYSDDHESRKVASGRISIRSIYKPSLRS